MGPRCAVLFADLFLFGNEKDFVRSFSRENQADIIKTFNFIARYLQDDLLNTDYVHFEQMVDWIFPAELHWSSHRMTILR